MLHLPPRLRLGISLFAWTFLACSHLRSVQAAAAPAAATQKPAGPRLENPMSVAYLRENLRQDSERWTLVTKGNHGHSTLTLNRERHRVDGSAVFTSFSDGPQPTATLDLTPVLGAPVTNATRRWVKDSARSLLIEDQFELSAAAQEISWGLMTTAAVELTNKGATLRQDGKVLHLEVLAPRRLTPVVIPLDPPPLQLDRRIKDLKRIELRAPVDASGGSRGEFKVRLTGG